VTRISEHGVPDEVWDEAARHYSEKELAAMVVHISVVNVWNRFNVATRQVAGSGW
jgi:alkylhydroperoxidase family enzyme